MSLCVVSRTAPSQTICALRQLDWAGKAGQSRRQVLPRDCVLLDASAPSRSWGQRSMWEFQGEPRLSASHAHAAAQKVSSHQAGLQPMRSLDHEVQLIEVCDVVGAGRGPPAPLQAASMWDTARAGSMSPNTVQAAVNLGSSASQAGAGRVRCSKG